VIHSSNADQWAQSNIKTQYTAKSNIKNKNAYGFTGNGTDFSHIQTPAGVFTSNTETASFIIRKGSSDVFRVDILNETQNTKIALRYRWSTDSYSLIFRSESSVNYKLKDAFGDRLIYLTISYSGSNTINRSGESRSVRFAPDEDDQESSTIIHHAQLEEGPNATSPIVTGSSTKSRSSDFFLISKSSLGWNKNEGTFYAEIVPKAYMHNDSIVPFLAQSDGPAFFRFEDNAPYTLGANDFQQDVPIINNILPAFEKSKIAISLTKGEIRLAANGDTALEGHSGSLLHRDPIVQSSRFSSPMVAWKKLLYIPTSLPATEADRSAGDPISLETLTSRP
jgi:hypothetical protein